MRITWVVLFTAACGFSDPRHEVPGDGSNQPDAPPSGDYALLDVQPRLANTGATIQLEGTFSSDVTVHFPGGADVAATLAGSHRATAIVPANATGGMLSITTGGATVGAFEFHHATSTLALGTFQQPYDHTNGARMDPVLVANRYDHAVVTTKDHVYVIDGTTDGFSTLASVEAARINADGTLGAFSIAGATTVARGLPFAKVIGDYIYVFGGDNDVGVVFTSIERARVNSDGSLEAFEVVPSTLAVPVLGASAELIGNKLYVLGGAAMGAIQAADIATDGTLGAFSMAGNLVHERGNQVSAVIGRYVYVVGGNDATDTVVPSAERAEIQADGTLGAFSVVSGVTLDHSYGCAAVVGDSFYVFAGRGKTEVERSVIAANGDLGPFAPLSGVSTLIAREVFALAIVKDSVYLVGSSPTVPIEHATLLANATPGSFSAYSPSHLITARSSANVVLGDWVYEIGGNNGASLATVERAPIAPDGSLGAFAAYSSSSLTQPRDGHDVVVIGNFVYVLGGTATTVERAPISDDGTLGAFTTVSGVTLNRYQAHALVLGHKLYILGGDVNGSQGLDVQAATINADGTIGAFSTVSGVTLANRRKGAGLVVLRDAVFMIGGADGSFLASVERAPMTNEVLGTFGASGALPTGVAGLSPHVFGGAIYGFGGGGAAGNVDTIWKAPLSATNTETGFTAMTAKLDRKRSMPNAGAIVIGNHVYLIGGGDDTGAITSVSMAPLE